MSGFNSNYFNRHLINDMRNALNSVFIGEGETSARNLEQFRERQASQRADRIATGQANNAAAKAAKAERATARAAAAARPPEQPSAGFGTQDQPGFGRNLTGTPTATTAAAGRGVRAGEINTDSAKWEKKNGRPLSINQDGSFNISQKTLDQAQANRNSETAESPPRKRYVNPNSPEGRVEASIAARNEPDMQRDRPRDQGGRIVTNARGVQDPDAVGYAAGQRAFDASIASDARASAKAAADARAAADDTEEPEDSIPNNGGLLTQLRGAISDQRGTDPRAANARAANALKDLTDINTREASARALATANTRRDFVAAAEYDASRPSVTANDDTTLPARAAQNAEFADTADGVRQSWGTRPSPNIPQDPNNGRNDINNFNSTPRPRPSNIVDPSADRNLMWNGTIGPNGGQRATPAGSTKSTAQPAGTPAAPAGRERMIAANARADFAEKMLEISTGNTRPVSLGRDAREDNSAKKRIYKQERDEQAAGKAREDQNAFRRSRFALDETMWNGTIGPNGGQRAKPAGSPKPTLKVENTVKPKTPPQTFFPMR